MSKEKKTFSVSEFYDNIRLTPEEELLHPNFAKALTTVPSGYEEIYVFFYKNRINKDIEYFVETSDMEDSRFMQYKNNFKRFPLGFSNNLVNYFDRYILYVNTDYKDKDELFNFIKKEVSVNFNRNAPTNILILTDDLVEIDRVREDCEDCIQMLFPDYIKGSITYNRKFVSTHYADIKTATLKAFNKPENILIPIYDLVETHLGRFNKYSRNTKDFFMCFSNLTKALSDMYEKVTRENEKSKHKKRLYFYYGGEDDKHVDLFYRIKNVLKLRYPAVDFIDLDDLNEILRFSRYTDDFLYNRSSNNLYEYIVNVQTMPTVFVNIKPIDIVVNQLVKPNVLKLTVQMIKLDSNHERNYKKSDVILRDILTSKVRLHNIVDFYNLNDKDAKIAVESELALRSLIKSMYRVMEDLPVDHIIDITNLIVVEMNGALYVATCLGIEIISNMTSYSDTMNATIARPLTPSILTTSYRIPNITSAKLKQVMFYYNRKVAKSKLHFGMFCPGKWPVYERRQYKDFIASGGSKEDFIYKFVDYSHYIILGDIEFPAADLSNLDGEFIYRYCVMSSQMRIFRMSTRHIIAKQVGYAKLRTLLDSYGGVNPFTMSGIVI